MYSLYIRNFISDNDRQNFCEYLEYKISELIRNSDNVETKGFWCDGVLLSEPEYYYSKKSVNDKRQVILKAFVGFDGQSEYRLILNFGNKSLSRYARGLDIKDCVPEAGQTQWFDINVGEKSITMQLY